MISSDSFHFVRILPYWIFPFWYQQFEIGISFSNKKRKSVDVMFLRFAQKRHNNNIFFPNFTLLPGNHRQDSPLNYMQESGDFAQGYNFW